MSGNHNQALSQEYLEQEIERPRCCGNREGSEMTQSIESMIEVLQAYKDGKKIEYLSNMECKWLPCESIPVWAFDTNKYRIAPEPKKKVKLEAWLDPHELRRIEPTNKFMPGPNWIRVPSEDKEIEI